MGNKRATATLIPLTLLFVSSPVLPATYLVTAGGTGDFPTIQAAIDASVAGDTILLADGTFTGDGNWDLDFGGRSIN